MAYKGDFKLQAKLCDNGPGKDKAIPLSFSSWLRYTTCGMQYYKSSICRMPRTGGTRGAFLGLVLDALLEEWYQKRIFKKQWLYDNYARYFHHFAEVDKGAQHIVWQGGKEKDKARLS